MPSPCCLCLCVSAFILVFYAVLVVSKEIRRLVLPRTSCLLLVSDVEQRLLPSWGYKYFLENWGSLCVWHSPLLHNDKVTKKTSEQYIYNSYLNSCFLFVWTQFSHRINFHSRFLISLWVVPVFNFVCLFSEFWIIYFLKLLFQCNAIRMF
jgi:hypothetical protein